MPSIDWINANSINIDYKCLVCQYGIRFSFIFLFGSELLHMVCQFNLVNSGSVGDVLYCCRVDY